MVQCHIFVVLPIVPKGLSAPRPSSVSIHTLDSDPGWERGALVTISNLTLGWQGEQPPFSFQAMVLKRENRINLEQNEAEVSYELEIADKEDIPEMLKLLKSLNPDKFENFPLMDDE